MNARDDYPNLTRHVDDWQVLASPEEINAALDEIDRLRQWKAEAIATLTEWDLPWPPDAVNSDGAE